VQYEKNDEERSNRQLNNVNGLVEMRRPHFTFEEISPLLVLIPDLSSLVSYSFCSCYC
jgi:hypothetical protein